LTQFGARIYLGTHRLWRRFYGAELRHLRDQPRIRDYLRIQRLLLPVSLIERLHHSVAPGRLRAALAVVPTSCNALGTFALRQIQNRYLKSNRFRFHRSRNLGLIPKVRSQGFSIALLSLCCRSAVALLSLQHRSPSIVALKIGPEPTGLACDPAKGEVFGANGDSQSSARGEDRYDGTVSSPESRIFSK